MDNFDVALSAEEECLLAAVAAAGRVQPSREHHRDMTEACPAFGRLLSGAESGAFDTHELVHLDEGCRYCELTLRLAFAEACPPAALAQRAWGGALRGAFDRHRRTCTPCAGRPHPMPRPRQVPAAPVSGADASSPIAVHAGPVSRPAAVAGAVRRWRAGDPTRRLGTWLALAGAAVVVVGLQSRSLRLPWALAHVGLGLATCVVGYYMGARRDRLSAEDRDPLKMAVARLHRRVFALALLTLGTLAATTAWRFRPYGAGELVTAISRLGMGGGAVLAGIASLVGAAGVTLLRAPTTLLPRREPSGHATRAHAASQHRLLLTSGSIRACGAACTVYAATHVVVALAIAPTLQMQAALLAATTLLAAAAVESFHPPRAYRRIICSWIKGGLIGISGDGAAQPPGAADDGEEHPAADIG